MYNGYGYGGGYGGAGMMGGQEMMIMLLCCCCCACLISVVGGYFTNIFCKLSTSLGSKCEPDETPAPIVPETSSPSTTIASVDTCNAAWGKTARGVNDPRPPIRPEYCQNATRAVGRDCYLWEVQPDPVTGMGRWMRKQDTEDGKADLRYGGECTPMVTCSTMIDPVSLEGYSETKPQPLLGQCKAVAATAGSETETIKFLTKEARRASVWKDTYAWTDSHSKRWYDRVKRYVGQRDLSAYILNSVKAVKNLKTKMQSDRISKSTFAYILEAAVRAPDNRPEWIIDTVNKYATTPLTTARNSERTFVVYLRTVIRAPPLVTWEPVIDNPRLDTLPRRP